VRDYVSGCVLERLEEAIRTPRIEL
jgi:hypothetical protein